MVVKQYTVHLVNLDPTIGSEIQKTRPCVIISPNEMNSNINTVMIAPMTSKSHCYPTRVPLKFKGKDGWIVCDQIRTIDKRRLIKKLGSISEKSITKLKAVIYEMLVA
ncbi:type II toxin-antitoxin system PemK/MazF family toxin [bacterium]|nr:type II toxin-antitoxin system PemK/MazF family toxin [bacterium]